MTRYWTIALMLSGLACDASGTSPPDSLPPDPQPTVSETVTATDTATSVAPDAGVPDVLPAAVPDARPVSPDTRALVDTRPASPDTRPLVRDTRLADTAQVCDLSSRVPVACVQYLPVTTWHCACDMRCDLQITCLGGLVPGVWQQTVRGPVICACTRK